MPIANPVPANTPVFIDDPATGSKVLSPIWRMWFENLNVTVATADASTLEGKTWESPGQIGSIAPNTGTFTTLQATGTLTLKNGSAAAPSAVFTGSSTTGIYYGAPGIGYSVAGVSVGLMTATGLNAMAIGATTPSTGSFSSVSIATPLPIGSGGTGNTTGTATVNANLTGPITSVGNATSIASQTGTGTTFVMDTLPSVTSTIGVGGATAANTGAGVTFPAAASPSSNANTLDDYEEGTWTPTDASGAGLSFTSNGYYTKIGNLVTVQAYVEFPATADGTAVKIGSFPFTSASGTNQYSSTVCLTNANVTASVLVDGGNTAFQLRSMTNGTFPNSTFSSQFIIFTLAYLT